MRHDRIAAVALFLFSGSAALAGESPSLEGAEVYFINLKDGDAVAGPVRIQMGLKGMGIAPAGVEKEFTGHHHILVDRPPLGEGPDGAEEVNANVPADANHLHFGKGQTETVLELTPGAHSLQLVLGDKDHIPHNPPVVSARIAITVK